MFNNLKNVSTQIHDFERRLCTQTQLLYIMEKFYMSQMKNLSTTLSSTTLHGRSVPLTESLLHSRNLQINNQVCKLVCAILNLNFTLG